MKHSLQNELAQEAHKILFHCCPLTYGLDLLGYKFYNDSLMGPFFYLYSHSYIYYKFAIINIFFLQVNYKFQLQTTNICSLFFIQLWNIQFFKKESNKSR